MACYIIWSGDDSCVTVFFSFLYKKEKKTKWFDFSLVQMRKQLNFKEKLLKKYYNDPTVRGDFFSFLKLYRKTRKSKHREFKNQLLCQLDNINDNNPSQ